MKFFSKILLMLFVAVASTSAFADSNQNSSSAGNGTTILKQKYKDPDIKRMPSKYYLELVYLDGMLSLESNYYEGEFDILLYNVDTGNSFAISSIFVGNPIFMDLEFGNYLVSAKNIDGLNFSGYLEISF